MNPSSSQNQEPEVESLLSILIKKFKDYKEKKANPPVPPQMPVLEIKAAEKTAKKSIPLAKVSHALPEVRIASKEESLIPALAEKFKGFMSKYALEGFFIASLSLAVALLANGLVKINPQLGLGLFALAGLLLVAVRPEGYSRMNEISMESQPRQAWETWFVLVLVGLGYYTRLYNLATYPATGVYSEGLLAARLPGLIGAAYTPHDFGGQITWPTLWHYQGILFGKLFGWSPGSFRAVSAVWGILSLPVFYLLCRRLTSPLTAAITSLLLVGFYYHFHFSMRYNPLILCFFVPIFAFGFLLHGLSSKKWYDFAICGFGLGLSLHGYYSLRVVAAVFGVWLVYLWMKERAKFPSFKNLALMVGAFLVTASPVLIWALKNPEQYNAYINSTNELAGKGLGAYLNKMWTKLPEYLKLFHIQETADSFEDSNIPEPILHPVMRVLFPVGFFYCLFQFWKPIPFFLILLFLAGLTPGLLGGLFPFAAARRIIVSFAAVMLFGGMAIERYRLAFNPKKSRAIGALLALSCFALAAWNIHAEFGRYRRYNENPVARQRSLCHDQFLTGKAIQNAPGARVICSSTLLRDYSAPFTIYNRENLSEVNHLRNFFVLEPGQDHLLLLDGAYEGAIPYLEAAYPGSKINVDREAVKLDKAYIKANANWFPQHNWANPQVYLISLKVTKEQVADFYKLSDMAGNSNSPRVAVWEGGFGSRNAGKNLRLGGTLVLDGKAAPVRFELPWKGWTLKVNGIPRYFGQDIVTDGGTNSFEISGKVPENFLGALPLKVSNKTQDFVATHRVNALSMAPGMVLRYIKGERNWKGRAEYSQRLLYPAYRMHEDPQIGPYSMKFSSRMIVPQDGTYQLSVRWFGGGSARITANGREVTSNTLGVDVNQSALPFKMSAGVPADIEVEWDYYGGDAWSRAFNLEYRMNDSGEFQQIPAEWLNANGK